MTPEEYADVRRGHDDLRRRAGARRRSRTAPTTRPRCPRWPGGSTRSSSTSGLTEQEADLDRPVRPRLHRGLRRGAAGDHGADRRGAAPAPVAPTAPAPTGGPRRPPRSPATTAAGVAARRRRRGAGASTSWCASAARSPCAGGSGSAPSAWSPSSPLWLRRRPPGSTAPASFLVPSPAATWDALVEMWRDGTLRGDLVGVAAARSASATRSRSPSASCSASLIGTFVVRRVVLRAADRVPALHPGQRPDAAAAAVAGHRREPEDHADRRRHGVLQHPDGRRRRPARAARAAQRLGHARRRAGGRRSAR